MSGPGEGPWVEPGEAPAVILLFPPGTPGPGFADELAAVLATGAVAAFVAGPVPGHAWGEARERCRAAGVAFLAHGGPDLALALGADGVHLGDPFAVADARRRLGPDALIGADCGGSRHAAMVAGEEGADYVVFGAGTPADAELCAWWSELFVVPCAASVRDEAEAGALVRAGADFLLAREAVWGGPEGPAAAATGLLRVAEAARAQRRHQGSS